MHDDDTIIRGREQIAEALGRSEKTVSRWRTIGILPARKAGPYANSALIARAADVARLREEFGEESDQ